MLPQLSTDNDQGELYLTDTVAMLESAMHLEVADAAEINGINDRIQLAQCEAVLQERLRRHWMAEGVSFVDPASCTLSEGSRFGRDVVVEPQCHFRGNTEVGSGCRIGPGCLLDNARLGDWGGGRSTASCATPGGASGCSIGPYAQVRPGSNLVERCHLGNFVEVKNSSLASDVKVNHLSYIGDADLGAGVNVGAGTITANYDGVHKHRTVIGAGSKTGANSRAGGTDPAGRERDRGRRLHPHPQRALGRPGPGSRPPAGEGELGWPPGLKAKAGERRLRGCLAPAAGETPAPGPPRGWP